MQQLAPRYDVLVAGGGNAALCAAISAATAGARVLVCEAAPYGFRDDLAARVRPHLRAMVEKFLETA